jgi:hypothetical protein
MAAFLFTGTNFNGTKSYVISNVPQPNITSSPSSLQVSEDAVLQAYTGANYTGTLYTFQGPTNLVSLWGLNGKIKSARLNNPTIVATQDTRQNKSITGLVTQKTPILQYDTGCKSKTCYNTNRQTNTVPATTVSGAIDWWQASQSCSFGGGVYCSPMDAGVCPILNHTATSVNWLTPANQGSASGRQVQCTYDMNNITDSPAAVQAFRAFPWDDKANATQEYDQTIMPYFCNKVVTTCPTDPSTGNPMTSCSRFVSTGPDGAACQQWVNDGLTGTAGYTSSSADTTMQNYCNQNNTPDCACVSRVNDSSFEAVSNLGTGGVATPNTYGKDSCWWKPCTQPKIIMRTSDLNILPGDCNINVCAQIQQVISPTLSSVTFGQVQNNTNCNFPPPGNQTSSNNNISVIPPTPTPATPPPGTPAPSGGVPPGTPVASSFLSRDWKWIALVVGVILLLIILAVVAYFLLRKKTPARTAGPTGKTTALPKSGTPPAKIPPPTGTPAGVTSAIAATH